MWDNAAAGWEENADFVDLQLAEATERLLDLAAIGPGAAVLELAAGPGGAGLAAARRVGPSGSVVLSDLAPKMLQAAARRARGLQNVSTASFDQSSIGFGEDSFDAVISRHGLMFAEDPVRAVAEGARVLRPGGRYAVMTWGVREENPWLGAVLDAVSDELGTPFPPPQVPGPFALAQPGHLTDVLRSAGLQAVAVESVPTPMSASSLQAWWERVPKLAGPLAAALAAMPEQMRDSIARRAAQNGARAARKVDQGIEFAGLSVLAVGAVPEQG